MHTLVPTWNTKARETLTPKYPWVGMKTRAQSDRPTKVKAGLGEWVGRIPVNGSRTTSPVHRDPGKQSRKKWYRATSPTMQEPGVGYNCDKTRLGTDNALHYSRPVYSDNTCERQSPEQINRYAVYSCTVKKDVSTSGIWGSGSRAQGPRQWV